MSKKIYVVEDNDTMRLGIVETLNREGYVVLSFDNGPEAIESFTKNPSDVAVLDLKMEPLNGIQVLEKLKELNSNLEVLIISAYGTVQDAVKAMQLGASDFLTKPFSPEELRVRIKKLLEKIENNKRIETLLEQNQLLSEEIGEKYNKLIGQSEKVNSLLNLINQVASNDSTCLIQGESGTGKELVARELHYGSSRKNQPFVKVNCGALNDNLLESELFGHEKGAFTGAVKRKKGRFELAHKGTLFLDEIGDISQAMQVKLLRVLQEGEFERVGGEETIDVDVRIVAATNKNLEKMIYEDKFREDLFYRLSIIPITVPPLRERKDDIPLLANYFLNKYSTNPNASKKMFEEDSLKILEAYSWPGNIRELQNIVERLSVISPNEIISADLVNNQLNRNSNFHDNFDKLPLEEAVFSFEKNLISQAMKKCDGVKNRAAKMLGISTSVLYYKLEKFGFMK
ncbi:MAG: sigma-54-dependent transcriptional regulator [Rhodothermaceae bacterium]